ncbi:phage terminase small subunit P27 family [Mycobacterium sp. HNNTM2301]|uniref:phage terminase small subunit P27 family n=1 Tax=Mycobacterium hainanense TaxID=3289775 RepID=UPI0035A7326B
MSRRPNPNHNPKSDQPRPVPTPPAGLGTDGLAAWKWIWSPEHAWITNRHLGLVERYCRLRDFVDQAFTQIREDGLLVTGSQKQPRVHPALTLLKNLAVELRLSEIELGLTPASESKTTTPTAAPTTTAPPTNTDTKPADTSIVTLLSDHRSRKS